MQFKCSLIPDRNYPVSVVKFSKNLLFSAGRDRSIHIWDLAKTDDLSLAKEYLNINDQRIMYSFDYNSSIHTNILTGEHLQKITDIAVNANTLCSVSVDKMMVQWDIHQMQPLHSYHKHNNSINSTTFISNDLNVTGGSDHLICIWDLRRNKVAQMMNDPCGSVNTVTVQGYSLFAGCSDGSVYVYDIRKGCRSVIGVGTSVGSMAIDGNTAALTSLEHNNIVVIDIDSGNIINLLSDINCKQSYIKLAFDRHKRLYSGCKTGKVMRFDNIHTIGATANCKELSPMNTPGIATKTVDTYDNMIASGSDNGVISIWKTK